MKTSRPVVAIVGAGPAGLRAARELGPVLGSDLVVLDRESQAGGIPRHANHPGYGVRDMGRFMSGPAYAKKLVAQAQRAGATIMTGVDVTGWDENKNLVATTPSGRLTVAPQALILATGARERPRPARMIPGDRGVGIYTTGQLQNLVHLHHEKVGTRAVIIGAELVSWSAALTLKEAGCSTELMVTEYPKVDSYRAFSIPGKIMFRTNVATNSRVIRINGKPRVTSVDIENIATGERTRIECDTVITTGDWIPDNELARMADLEMDSRSLSPLVDTSLRTSREGIFAIGNLVHPVETADCAALDGVHVKKSVLDYLSGCSAPRGDVRLTVESPLRWVAPGIAGNGEPAARDRLLFWCDDFIVNPTVTLTQGGRDIAITRVPWPAAPGRIFRVPGKVLRNVDPRGGDVLIRVK